MLSISHAIRALASAENHLWELTETHKFSGIAPKDGVISGEALIAKIDAYFESAGTPSRVRDLSFLMGQDGKIDPEVAAFSKAHPQAMAGFIEYANQHVEVADKKAGISETDAQRTIQMVDALYPGDTYAPGQFNASTIPHAITGELDFIADIKHFFGMPLASESTALPSAMPMPPRKAQSSQR